MNYVPIVVATDLEVHFSVLKKGVSKYFWQYSVYIQREREGDRERERERERESKEKWRNV